MKPTNNIEEIFSEIIENAYKSKTDDLYLENGLLGKSIFLMEYSDLTGDEKYKDIAYSYLNHINSSLSLDSSLGLYNGLLGVCVGYLILTSNNYIDYNIDDMCQEVDDKLYVFSIHNLEEKYNKGRYNEFVEFHLNYMLYLLFRHKLGYRDKFNQNIYKGLLVKIFNHIYQNHDQIFLEEPIPYSCNYNLAKFIVIMAFMYQMGIENTRIQRILEEFKIQLLYKIPYFHYNRIVLMGALIELDKSINLDSDWKRFINMLKMQVNVNSLICEIPDSNLISESGLVMLYYVMKFFNRNEVTIPFSKDSLIKKVEESNFINSLLNVNNEDESWKEGLNGRLGLILMYYDLKKQNK